MNDAPEFLYTMNRKTRDFMLFLALLLLWGQALASPFLACRHLHGSQEQSAQIQVEQPPMAMAAAHAAHHMPTHEHALLVQQQVPNDQMDPGAETKAHHAKADCDLSCQFCRGVTAPDLADAIAADYPAHMPWNELAIVLSAALPPPADHFRPPAVA
jgi:hypothetical protein